MEHRSRPAGQLIEGALPGGLVGPPPQKSCAVPEAMAGEVIVLDLDKELRPQGLPFCGTRRAPAAGATRRIACESRWSDELRKTRGESGLVAAGERGGKPHMMQQAALV